jgi:signal recognition particle receptor subunit beta
MAIFDPREQRLCVRIVYDGVAGAGKTTNLRQLSTLFAGQRAMEVCSPAELEGRTLYFDWLQLNAGVVAGIPLLCQIISVPGQVALTPRRRHLLATADVIVYVSESSAAAVARAREGLSIVDAVAAERRFHVPLVIQANKQDQRDALDSVALVRELGREDVTMVEAIASEGIGVVDTAVAAIRALSRTIQRRADEGNVFIEVGAVQTMERALADVAGAEIDPEAAAEMLLEEASAAMLLSTAVEPDVPTPRVESATDPSDDADAPSPPALPDENVPTGFIWPAHTGRTTLRSLSIAGALTSTPHIDGGGAVCHHAFGYVLRTHMRLRFEGAEAARQALVRAARERTQLEDMLIADTVVVAQAARDGAWWIWTVMPAVTTLESALRDAEADSERQRTLLDAYGVALVDAVRAGRRHGFGLDLSPRAFGVEGGAIRYVGDTSPSLSVEAVGEAIDGAVAFISQLGLDAGVLRRAFDRRAEAGEAP